MWTRQPFSYWSKWSLGLTGRTHWYAIILIWVKLLSIHTGLKFLKLYLSANNKCFINLQIIFLITWQWDPQYFISFVIIYTLFLSTLTVSLLKTQLAGNFQSNKILGALIQCEYHSFLHWISLSALNNDKTSVSLTSTHSYEYVNILVSLTKHYESGHLFCLGIVWHLGIS